MRPNEIKFGMRLRGQFKTPIERQIGEATAILIDSKKEGISLLNSKSEFNRCSLPRITAGTHKEILDEMTEEAEEEKRMKADIRCMRKRRKEEKQEDKKRKIELGKSKRRKVEMAVTPQIPDTINEIEINELEEIERGRGEGGNAGIQALVMMGQGRDLLLEGPGPGAKLVSRRKAEEVNMRGGGEGMREEGGKEVERRIGAVPSELDLKGVNNAINSEVIKERKEKFEEGKDIGLGKENEEGTSAVHSELDSNGAKYAIEDILDESAKNGSEVQKNPLKKVQKMPRK